jgi:hypothetical protein
MTDEPQARTCRKKEIDLLLNRSPKELNPFFAKEILTTGNLSLAMNGINLLNIAYVFVSVCSELRRY